ncbi:2-hydroxyacid dehydrogenase [Fulvivirga sedimenti]|uniref:2-hydroxyacid dehydrogenase n=1 Tax=Fulvivirga sedimenti TaxID=2879465 RepID=A0A9X1HXH7_9BACT|nr:2-hydroxyacid dehydrogenase [Fulvivirga sedimenti]MCA6079150.1 2-hydroxyacid dehydrogenase [Fulvivirga sedimenti]
MKIAVFSSKKYDVDSFNKLEHNHTIHYFETTLSESTVALAAKHDAICAFVNDHLNDDVLQRLNELNIKAVFLRCAGFNNADITAAEKYGIAIYRVPAYSPEAVAEHAMALVLCLSRKIHKAYNRIRDNNFSLERLTGFTLNGKIIGVVGTGNIGKCFCRIALGFGCRVIAYDVREDEELVKMGVEYHSLDKVLEHSHIISLHVPLFPETHHMIRKESIKKMRDGVMIINTSRGALIKTRDVIKALKSGKIGYLGIDVYEQEENLFFEDLSEKIIQDDLVSRLMTFPNVLITSHQAFLTSEALQEIAEVTLQNVEDHLNGVSTKNRII